MGFTIHGNKSFARARLVNFSEKVWFGDAKLTENLGRDVPEEFLYNRHTAANDSDYEFSVAKPTD